MLLNKIVGTMLFLGTNLVSAADNYYGPFDRAYNPVYGTPDNIRNPFTIQGQQPAFNFDDAVEMLSHYEYPASIHFGNVGNGGLVADSNRIMANIFSNLPQHLRDLGESGNRQKWEWLINSIYTEGKGIEQLRGVEYGRAFLLFGANSLRHCELRDAHGYVIPKKLDATGYALYPSLLELSRCIHEFMLVHPANDKEKASFEATRRHYNDFIN